MNTRPRLVPEEEFELVASAVYLWGEARDALRLRRVKGLDDAQIAAELRTTPAAVADLIRQAEEWVAEHPWPGEARQIIDAVKNRRRHDPTAQVVELHATLMSTTHVHLGRLERRREKREERRLEAERYETSVEARREALAALTADRTLGWLGVRHGGRCYLARHSHDGTSRIVSYFRRMRAGETAIAWCEWEGRRWEHLLPLTVPHEVQREVRQHLAPWLRIHESTYR